MKPRRFLPGEPRLGDTVTHTKGTVSFTKPAHQLVRGHRYLVVAVAYRTEESLGRHRIFAISPWRDDGRCGPQLSGYHATWSFQLLEHGSQDACPPTATSESMPGESALNDLFARARQSSAWQRLCRSNLGLALALATLQPRTRGGEGASLPEIDRMSAKTPAAICRILALPTSALGVLARLHPSWGEVTEAVSLEWPLLILRHLLSLDREATSLLSRHDQVTRPHVLSAAWGAGELDFRNLFASAAEIRRSAWFFALPFAERHWLVRERKALSAAKDEHPAGALLPELPRLGEFKGSREALRCLRRQRRLQERTQAAASNFSSDPRLSGRWPTPPLRESRDWRAVRSQRQLMRAGALPLPLADGLIHSVQLGVYFFYQPGGVQGLLLGVHWKGDSWEVHCIHGTDTTSEERSRLKEQALAWLNSQPPAHRRRIRSKTSAELLARLHRQG